MSLMKNQSPTSDERHDEYIVLTFRAYDDEGIFVAECLELGTASQGDTPGEAIAMAHEATVMYLSAAADLGELPRIFRERNVRVLSAVPHEIELRASVHADDIVKLVVHHLGRSAAVPA